MTSCSSSVPPRAALAAILLGLISWLAGCASPATTMPPATPGLEADPALHPGDIVKIAFPAAPNLDTTQQIRRDGKLNLYLIGEIKAADRAPAGAKVLSKPVHLRDIVTEVERMMAA